MAVQHPDGGVVSADDREAEASLTADSTVNQTLIDIMVLATRVVNAIDTPRRALFEAHLMYSVPRDMIPISFPLDSDW